MHVQKSYHFCKAIWNCFIAFSCICFAVLDSPAQTVVEVGGEIESQEWTSDNVYHVTSHLVINTGVELVIRPGVTVKFRQGTGMTVNGSFKVYGEDNGTVDTVLFQPLYNDPPFNWKWLGIHFSRVQVPNTNLIDHARIENASTGISISGDSRHVMIKNTLVRNSLLFGIVISASNEIVIDNCRVRENTGAGINIQNSNDCVILNNHISDNNDGIWLLASETGNYSKGNTIAGNVIRNSTFTNIFLNNVDGGKCTGNVIEANFIENSFIGIQLGSPSSMGGRNHVISNVIVTNKISGSGLIVYQDTALISHNIFWLNKDAVILNRSVECQITNNSFYDNGYLNNGSCVVVNSGSAHPHILNNTFTGNGNVLINLNDPTGPVIHYNNFFKNRRVIGLITNNTTSTITVDSNFWGSTNSDEINQMLAGNFSFDTFLPEPDTVAPVSPPIPAFKQVVNNQVRLFWSKNPEADLTGYSVHFGGYQYYSFDEILDVGADTAIMLDMVGIYDTIAITAYDFEFPKEHQQATGHESPFSFPSFFPYAGPDTAICKDQPEFLITQSTYFGDYINLNWVTSGDGEFSAGNELLTFYFPGQNDLDSGMVKLKLIVLADIGVFYEDSFILSIRDIPLAYAGNDTILAADSSLFLSNAYAENFDTLFWSSTGNGVFDDPGSLNPFYTPGEQDILNGSVGLVLHAVSACGSITDTLNLVIERRYTLEGRVWNNSELLQTGVVLAMIAQSADYKADRLAIVEDNGVFRFSELVAGEYLLYAVPDTSVYPNTIPGYYAHKHHWQEAYTLDLYANTFDLDLLLQSLTNPLPLGTGSISGHFISPEQSFIDEDIYCANWFISARNEIVNCQDGVSNITILLYNSDGSKLLGHTLTNASGNFSFNKLPYGGYIVDAEKAGYVSIPSPLLILNPQNPVIDDVFISIEPQLIKIEKIFPTKESMALEVFPNPAMSEIYLKLDKDLVAPYTVDVHNLYNQQVFKCLINIKMEKQDIFKINIGHLQAGMYVGIITSSHTVRTFSFVKY